MASSYAALVSLQTLIHSIQHHPDPPVSLHCHQVQSLLQILAFLQEFLQLYSHLDQYPTQHLESLIKQAAYAAEDVIESCIVDRIEKSTTGNRQVPLFDLHSVIELMDAMKKQAMEINKIPAGDDDQQPGSSMPAPSLVSPSPSMGQNSPAMVGFDELFNDILHRLTRDQSGRRQIIPVVGMGGIGKTTLAVKAYEHGLVKHYFDSRVWVTISQNFVIREILLEIICQQCQMSKDDLKDESMEQLGLRIHKSFSRKRYLVVIDDLWNIEAWSMMRPFFPDNCTGSRIVITTRLANVATMADPNSISIQMNLLDGDKSWDLFCKMAFGGHVCPFELEESGKTIARNCRGLPLSIVVIGGILSKSKQTKYHWEHVARNLSSIVNLEDNERCLKILQLSYRQLPIHLKPCFLYLGLYPEDERIKVSYLVKVMVAEGFLKPVDGELIEAVAEKYVQELVDRNLLLIDERGSTGNIKYCRIHDLVRDLCVREAKEENFLYVLEDQNLDIKGDIDMQRRIAVRKMVLARKVLSSQACEKLKSAALARSLKWEFEWTIPSFTYLKLLRIFNSSHTNSIEYDGTFYNLRFLSWVNHYLPFQIIPRMSLIWNLQTIIIEDPPRFLRPMKEVLPEIWKMRQLRHINVNALEFHPPINSFVLSNLQTLCKVSQFECTNDVVEKLPNIQKLVIGIYYERGRYYADYCLNNLQYLLKLEHLRCTIDDNLKDNSRLLGNITFPHSLKKLALESIRLHWEDMTAMVGSLPNLEKLKLKFIEGPEWRPTKGQFLRLKFLEVSECYSLEHWTADSSHFPILERLNLHGLNWLAEIPPGIGEIPTLQLIQLGFSNHSAVVSAKAIAEEQDALGNSELQIRILAFASKDIQLESLASQNFQVKIYEYPSPNPQWS